MDPKELNSEELEFEDEEESVNPAEALKKLRAKLKEMQGERDQYLTGWQRAKADFINAKRDAERERTSAILRAKENLVTHLLNAIDSFEAGFAHKETWESLPKEWSKGMELIYKELLSALAEEGIKKMPLEAGSTFDPNLHMAVQMTEVEEEKDDNKVLEVLQPGYQTETTIIRPAKVRVGMYKES